MINIAFLTNVLKMKVDRFFFSEKYMFMIQQWPLLNLLTPHQIPSTQVWILHCSNDLYCCEIVFLCRKLGCFILGCFKPVCFYMFVYMYMCFNGHYDNTTTSASWVFQAQFWFLPVAVQCSICSVCCLVIRGLLYSPFPAMSSPNDLLSQTSCHYLNQGHTLYKTLVRAAHWMAYFYLSKLNFA